MKKILALARFVMLGGCLALFAQTSGAPAQNQDQQPLAPEAAPQQMAPESNAPAPAEQPQANAPAEAQPMTVQTTVQGCLSQTADGQFLLADNTGKSYILTGAAARLGAFIGKEIRVDGTGTASSADNPGAMSADTGMGQQIQVSKIKKMANTCPAAPAANPAGSSGGY